MWAKLKDLWSYKERKMKRSKNLKKVIKLVPIAPKVNCVLLGLPILI